ncbi:hypothetical protein ACFL0M_14030 [Thermodesulfobacteriota bacterium]
MEIIRAKLEDIKEIPNGDLCIGVERPKKYFDKALQKKKRLIIFSLRPDEELIPYPDKAYDKMGVRVTNELPDSDNGMIVISSRGAPPEILQKLKEKGYEFQNANCPYVQYQEKNSIKLLGKGYHLVISSNPKHHGIERLSQIAQARGQKLFCAEYPEDVDQINLRPSERIAVIAQTTQSLENFKAVVNKLIDRYKDIRVVNTICLDSLVRYPETEKLARETDLVLVIGRSEGKTTRMVEICQQVGTPAHRFDRVEVLRPEWFEGVNRVGLIGGNTSHKSLVDRIEARVREISKEKKQ